VKPEVKSGFALPGVCSVYNPVSFYPGQRVELEFDYVIIGAGSAGCVLANRLSASGKNTVLVLDLDPNPDRLRQDLFRPRSQLDVYH
jgi:hypothetical protein